MAELTKENVESMQVHNETWVGQIRDAMNVNGGDIENATTQDYVLVRLSFFFRPKKNFYTMESANSGHHLFLIGVQSA